MWIHTTSELRSLLGLSLTPVVRSGVGVSDKSRHLQGKTRQLSTPVSAAHSAVGTSWRQQDVRARVGASSRMLDRKRPLPRASTLPFVCRQLLCARRADAGQDARRSIRARRHCPDTPSSSSRCGALSRCGCRLRDGYEANVNVQGTGQRAESGCRRVRLSALNAADLSLIDAGKVGQLSLR
jgi:hypothetical protein